MQKKIYICVTAICIQCSYVSGLFVYTEVIYCTTEVMTGKVSTRVKYHNVKWIFIAELMYFVIIMNNILKLEWPEQKQIAKAIVDNIFKKLVCYPC